MGNQLTTIGASSAMLSLEFTTLQIAAGLFAIAALASIFFWFFRKDGIGKTAWGISLVAAVVLTVSVIVRWINVGHIPYVQLYETMLFSTWAMSVVAVVSDQAIKTRLPSTIASIVGTLILIYIIQWPAESKVGSPLVPALQSPWLDVHIATAFLSYAGFAISAGASVVYFFNHSEAVDELSYRLVAFAFPLLGLGIILGAVWANQAWGSYWSWDPKETAALVSWLVYAGYLHARLVLKWKGTKASIFNLVGFVCVIFTWIGLNLVARFIDLQSLHTYSG
jgi:ABC-type transport system involved in cytochrome c biogenesis permease subunit